MKQKVIDALTAGGMPAALAESAWSKLVAHVGFEPTEALLQKMSEASICAVIGPAGAMLTGLFSAAPKGKKWKAGRQYSAAEWVTFHTTSEAENEEFLAEFLRAVNRQPCIVAVDGKVDAAESTKLVQAAFDEEIIPTFVVVGGVSITPVLPGQERMKEAKLYYIDPFDPSGYLDMNMTSPKTGASFAGYSDEAISAMACLFVHELQGEGSLSLRRFADEKRGKSPAEILGSGKAAAVWRNPKNRMPAKRAKKAIDPFVDLGSKAIDSGTAEAGKLDLYMIHEALVELGLDVSSLRTGISPHYTANLRTAKERGPQLLIDLTTMYKDGRLSDGSYPLETYMRNAQMFAGPRTEADIFRRAILALEQRSKQVPKFFVVGCQAEPRAAESLKVHCTPFTRRGEFQLVLDTDIKGGERLDAWRNGHINSAKALIILCSANNFGLMFAAAESDKRVIPILVRSCDIGDTFGSKVPLPRTRKPATDEDWPDIARELAAIATS